MAQYDLLVIGSGPAGQKAAVQAAAGAVSFFAYSDTGRQGIFVAHGGTFLRIADNIAMGPWAD